MEPEGSVRQTAADIYETCLKCPFQTIAMNAITTDILNGDFKWTSTVETHTSSIKIQESTYEHAMLSLFVRRLIMEICLYGRAIYSLQLVEVPAKDDIEMNYFQRDSDRKGKRRRRARKRYVPVVESGLTMNVQWNDKKHDWDDYDETGKLYTRENGYYRISPFPPLRVGTENVPVYHTFASVASRYSKMNTLYYRNSIERDRVNTHLEVYTSVSKDLMGAGAAVGSEDLFQARVHSGMNIRSPPGDIYKPIATQIEDRLRATLGLTDMTDELREQMQYKQTQAGGSVTKVSGPPKKHAEHIITSGFESRDVPRRYAPEDLFRHIDHNFYMILYSYHVIPQVMGIQVSPERVNSAAHISKMGTDRYAMDIRSLLKHIQLAIRNISSEAVGDVDTYIIIDPCMSEHTLEKIEPVITLEAMKKYYMCVYTGLEEKDLDDDLLRMRQLSAIDSLKGGERDPLSQEQKLTNMKAKSERAVKKV